MFGAHDVVGGRALRREPLVQPAQDRANFRIEIAQALNELYRKRALQRLFLEIAQDRLRIDGGIRCRSEQPVCKLIRFAARRAASYEEIRDPA